ncbi:MAG TPA: hypothetical protein VHN14_26420 [Kofleriaceae bacterium]|nr:hypothetical protein [Kofleriaceae bacterium]
MALICKRIAFQAEPTDVRGDHYRETCNGGEVPAGAPPALVALVDSRPSLVKAIDSAVPAEFTADLQAFLTSDATLALYDNDTMSSSIATLADLLDEIAHDDAALAALAHASVREGYRPAETAFGVPAALASARASVAAGAGSVVPSLHPVLAKTVPAITSGGAAHGEWDALVAALSATLLDASAPSDAASLERTATLAADFFLSERADLTEPSPEPLVRRDPRGIARIALVGGAVPEPFVDANHDKLADIDALGRFIDAQGRPIATAAPFATAGDAAPRDPEGRVGTFAYVDLGKTVIGALGHDAAQLFDPATGMALDLARGASALLGPRVMTSHAFPSGASLPYLGYDTTQSPLLDMTYGFAQLLRDPNVRDLLGLADTLLADHDAAVARLIEAAIATARIGDAHPEAQILATAPMWDDLMPLVRQIVARPQLVRALLAALERPEVKQLGQRFSDLMTYADRFDLDPVTQAVIGSFSRKPDRTKPDDALNRSLFQRFLHLLNDSNRVRLCNKDGATIEVAGITYPPFGLSFGACNLIQIDNLATFFVRAVAHEKSGGNVVCEDAAGDVVACTANGARPRPGATLVFKDSLLSAALDLLGDDFLEGQAGIVGFRRHPTPEALTRVLFLSPMPAFLTPVLDPVRDRDGDLYQGQHGGTLPVLENGNFYGQIRPIIQAFVDNGSEQLFVDLLSVLHKHWPSAGSITTQTTNPNGPNYAYGTNARSWEPLISEALAGDLLPALTDTAAELDAITVNGKSYATVVTNAAGFLINPLAGLTDRQGHPTTTTADGKPVTQLSIWHVLADAYRGKQARLRDAGGEGAAWSSATRAAIDLLFRSANHGTGWKFRNGHIRAVTRAVIAFVRGRIDAHDARGDRMAWVSQTVPKDARDLLTHPVFAGVADLAAKLSVDPGARAALEALLHDAFDETTSPAMFAILRTATADLIQLFADDADLVPISHLAGRLIAPGKPYLATQLDLVQKLTAGDDAAVLARLASQMFHGYDAADPGVPAIAAIANGIGEVDRLRPGDDLYAPWTPGDFARILTNVAAFLREQQRGMPRFIAIVKGRNP